MKIECNFINGEKNGIYKEHDDHGRLLIECNFIFNKITYLKKYDSYNNIELDINFNIPIDQNIFEKNFTFKKDKYNRLFWN